MPHTLSLGSRGPDVLRLQLILSTRAVATLVNDGIYGVRTRAAVAQAQRRLGGEVTGEATPDLLTALRALPAMPVEVLRVRTPLTLEEVREALREGHRRAFGGEEPGEGRLRMARAQMVVEHGWDGHGIWVHCLGDVMVGHGWAGPWFWMTAVEQLNGAKVARRSRWRAYAEPLDGAEGWWRRMAEQWPRALALYGKATPEVVARALKEEPTGAYMTSPAEVYGALLRAVWERLT